LATCEEASIACPPGPSRKPKPLMVGAVTMLLMRLFSAREIAAAYGVSRATLYNWRDELKEDPGFMGDLAARLESR
jgi:DNA invertase Pin-like site-specific DNA recombinase